MICRLPPPGRPRQCGSRSKPWQRTNPTDQASNRTLARMTLIVKVSPADKARTCQGNSPVKASQANSSRATRTKVIRNNVVRTSRDARTLIN